MENRGCLLQEQLAGLPRPVQPPMFLCPLAVDEGQVDLRPLLCVFRRGWH